MPTPLWTPAREQMESSAMYRFMQTVNDAFGLQLSSYPELWTRSVEHAEDFWDQTWKFFHIQTSEPYTQVFDDIYKMPATSWFSGAKLNYAQNILERTGSEPALIFRGENDQRRTWSRKELIEAVQKTANGLRAEGIGPGSFVAAYMPNVAKTVIAMLASAAVGATFCSCTTDIGPKAAIDQIGQVKPEILFTSDGYLYKRESLQYHSQCQRSGSWYSQSEKSRRQPLCRKSGRDP